MNLCISLHIRNVGPLKLPTWQSAPLICVSNSAIETLAPDLFAQYKQQAFIPHNLLSIENKFLKGFYSHLSYH